jgi:hypothetical protein
MPSRNKWIEHLQALVESERAAHPRVDPLTKREIYMADDTSKTALDRKLISLSEVYEVQYWTQAFGVTAEQLREAVAAVGNSAEKVREYLQK